jgi:transcriptional regulator of NAD metabolism
MNIEWLIEEEDIMDCFKELSKNLPYKEAELNNLTSICNCAVLSHKIIGFVDFVRRP